jgi:hypothetical protein
MSGGVNAGDGERAFGALAAKEDCQRAADVAVSDKGKAQEIIVAGRDEGERPGLFQAGKKT